VAGAGLFGCAGAAVLARVAVGVEVIVIAAAVAGMWFTHQKHQAQAI